MTAPVVSVVIDTYNYGRFVEGAIDSTLAQDFPKEYVEILVVDDGSTDDTAERVKKYGDSVKYFRKPNGGQASAINYGIAHASGRYVAFLDGDDVWLPGKLSRVVREFEKQPQALLLYHKFCFWDSRRGEVWDPRWGSQVSGDILADRQKLVMYLPAPTSSLVFRRDVLERIGPVPEQCSFMHDNYLTTAALFFGPVAAVADCLTKNRVHGGNLWFAEHGEVDPGVLERRISVRRAMIAAAHEWIERNALRSSWSRVRILFRRWELGQDLDEFQIKAPGRFRYFVHRCRWNLINGYVMTRPDLAFQWVKAVFELIVGRERSHYLEGVRTRVKKMISYVGRRSRPAEQGSSSL